MTTAAKKQLLNRASEQLELPVNQIDASIAELMFGRGKQPKKVYRMVSQYRALSKASQKANVEPLQLYKILQTIAELGLSFDDVLERLTGRWE